MLGAAAMWAPGASGSGCHGAFGAKGHKEWRQRAGVRPPFHSAARGLCASGSLCLVRPCGGCLWHSGLRQLWCREQTLQLVGRVLAKLLDQDEDGLPEDPEVVRQLVGHKAAVLLTATPDEYDDGVGQVGDHIAATLWHGVIKNDIPIWNCTVADVWVYVEIFETEVARSPKASAETAPDFREWRATWEELFHLITHVGLGCAYPEVWGFRAGLAPGAIPERCHSEQPR